MLVHLRLVVPPESVDAVLSLLREAASTRNIVVLPATAERPGGRIVLCDVGSQEAPLIVADLQDLDVARLGSIAIQPVDLEVSDTGVAVRPRGRSSVAWEQVEARTCESTELAASHLAFMALAMVIAASGIIQSTAILIVGAMIVGPDFGPVAGACVAVVERRPGPAVRSLLALVVGFGFGFAITGAVFAVLRATDITGTNLVESASRLSPAVSEVLAGPNFFSFFVAACAGVAGILSLSSTKSGPLIGVLVSVTTIPAAANVALAVTYARWDTALGSAEQLGANIATLLVIGTATLIVQRLAFARQRTQRKARHSEPSSPR